MSPKHLIDGLWIKVDDDSKELISLENMSKLIDDHW